MYYFIVNPNACSGLGEKIWKRTERRLQRSGIEYRAMITRRQGDARAFAQELTRNSQEPQILVAVGGDGTVNEMLDGISFDSSVALGYIPAGSGNDLARSLKLSKNWKRCLKKILSQKHHKMLDYGILSYEKNAPVHRRFMISCGIGMDAAVCHSLLDLRESQKKCFFRRGRLSYALQGIRQLLRAHPIKGYLLLDGIKKVEFNHIFFISVHVQPYEGGGFRFAPQADGGDGILDVCVMHGASRLLLILVLVDAWLGRKGRHRGMRRYSCREIQIHVDQPMPVHVDGESCYCQTDIQLACIEKKIKFFV